MQARYLVWWLVFCASAFGQVLYPGKEVRVNGLPALMARSHDPADVLLTALDTIIHDRNVCCGKDSALEDSAGRADPASFKDVAAKLQGRHLLSDGRPIMVAAEFVEPSAVNSGGLIAAIRSKQALLFEWNSRIYVCYGVVYDETVDYSDGSTLDAIHKLLLLDPRYSDSRREAAFDRTTDNWSNVQGMLRVAITQQ